MRVPPPNRGLLPAERGAGGAPAAGGFPLPTAAPPGGGDRCCTRLTRRRFIALCRFVTLKSCHMQPFASFCFSGGFWVLAVSLFYFFPLAPHIPIFPISISHRYFLFFKKKSPRGCFPGYTFCLLPLSFSRVPFSFPLFPIPSPPSPSPLPPHGLVQ